MYFAVCSNGYVGFTDANPSTRVFLSLLVEVFCRSFTYCMSVYLLHHLKFALEPMPQLQPFPLDPCLVCSFYACACLSITLIAMLVWTLHAGLPAAESLQVSHIDIIYYITYISLYIKRYKEEILYKEDGKCLSESWIYALYNLASLM
jgi:hypothetical protein